MAAVNRLTLARAAYGILLAAAPGLVVRAYGGQPGRADRTVARILGWRQLIQAAACAGAPGAQVLLLGAEADAAHALSAVALAAADRPRRRAGLTEALLASSLAVAGMAAARRAGPAGPAGGPGAQARLSRWRQCAAARVAAYAVPAAAHRWTEHRDDARLLSRLRSELAGHRLRIEAGPSGGHSVSFVAEDVLGQAEETVDGYELPLPRAQAGDRRQLHVHAHPGRKQAADI